MLDSKTNNTYIEKIKSNFPNLDIISYKINTKGRSNDIVIVNDEIVFRFPKEEFAMKNLKNEIKLLDLINSNINFSIPSYSYVQNNFEFGGYPIIKGEQLKVKDIKNKSMQDSIAKDIGNFLSQIHGIDINKFKGILDLDVEKYYSFDPGYVKYIVGLYKSIEKDFEKNYFDKIVNYIESEFKYDLEYVTFVHGDLQPKNIIYSEELKSISGVIDFTDSSIYDPALDFCWFLKYGNLFVNKILANYEHNYGNIIARAKKLHFKKTLAAFPLEYEKKGNNKFLIDRLCRLVDSSI